MGEPIFNHDVFNRVRNAYDKTIQFVALEGEGNIKEEAPVDQGRLQGSWSTRKDGKFRYIIRSNVDYALTVQEGSGPRVIEPVNAQALHFFVGGAEVFAKRVQHPGTKPNPYIDRALNRIDESTIGSLSRIALSQFGL